jgi:hypothetical protein
MLTQNPDLLPSSVSGQHKETEDKMAELSDKITKLVDEAGCNGNVDDVRRVNFEPFCDGLNDLLEVVMDG